MFDLQLQEIKILIMSVKLYLNNKEDLDLFDLFFDIDSPDQLGLKLRQALHNCLMDIPHSINFIIIIKVNII